MISNPIAPEPTNQATCLVSTNERSVLQGQILLPPAQTSQRQNASGPPGSEDLTPVTHPMRRVLPFETLVNMNGTVIPVLPRTHLFRRCWFYGISSFTAGGIPVANAANLSLGNNERYLPWTVQPYNGTYGILLDAPIGHVYDLSKIFVFGNIGDSVFFSAE